MAATTSITTATSLPSSIDIDTLSSTLKGQHCLSIKQFNRSQIDYIFSVASWMERTVDAHGQCDLAKGKLLVNLFYEPSTRTSSSFHAAMMRLGGMVTLTNTAQSLPFSLHLS
jgi:aspartate carbamoyltransferase catalytic subunit